MNNLPQHRQILWGRTHGKTWEPTDSDPILFFPAVDRFDRIAGVLLAVGIGSFFATLVAYSI